MSYLDVKYEKLKSDPLAYRDMVKRHYELMCRHLDLEPLTQEVVKDIVPVVFLAIDAVAELEEKVRDLEQKVR